jgi:hypothetical protein
MHVVWWGGGGGGGIVIGCAVWRREIIPRLSELQYQLLTLFYTRGLKVFTNEKRGGLRVISFDRPPFKLLSRKFSKESVQAPSYERHKTTQQTPVSIICKQLLIPNNAIVSGCDTIFTS